MKGGKGQGDTGALLCGDDGAHRCSESADDDDYEQVAGRDEETVAVRDGESAMLVSSILCMMAAENREISSKRIHPQVAKEMYRRPSVRSKFVNTSTGMRLRYLEWGAGEEVVVMLHDIALSADAWDEVGRELADDGYRVFAVDLRGHGDSTTSGSGDYYPSIMAADLESFILELDLYVRPVAVVGVGLGGAIALTLANRAPRLVGAIMVMEFCPFHSSGPEMMAFFPAQALVTDSLETALEMLCADAWGSPMRAPDEAARSIQAMMRTESDGSCRLRMDPRWFFQYKMEDLQEAAGSITCLVALVAGQNSHAVSGGDLQRFRSLVSRSPKVETHLLRGLDHHILTGSKDKVYNCIADFLVEAGPAILKENKETRRPELLGLKPLPQYATIEEAIKALKPREIPSAAAVEEELRKLAIEGGYSTDDSEGPTRGGCATALAKDPSDYFGFIG